MKNLVTLFCLGAALVGHSQAPRLEKVWETDSVVAIPESVLADARTGRLYISLIDGAPWGKDGKGGIAVINPDGKSYDSTWLTGLNAPKGMGIFKNKLYVADMNEVVVIDVPTHKIEKRIVIDSATWLNDITVSDKGVVYVSDSKTGKVWQVVKNKATLYLQDLKGINGLKAVKDGLVIASGTALVKADSRKKITAIATLPQGGDGIEPVGNGDLLVTSWSGYIYYVTAKGVVTTLLDTQAKKINAADIGYDPVKKMVYVPTFFAKTIVAYQLK
ncbi:MAG: ATP-binding protein [Chitinophagaceae bacterium]